jgi:hypothetical protein
MASLDLIDPTMTLIGRHIVETLEVHWLHFSANEFVYND